MKFLTFPVFIFLTTTTCIQSYNNWPMSSAKRFENAVNAQISKMKVCDQSTIPVMSSFNMTKFLGEWYELGKTASTYIDVNDGVWTISPGQQNNNSFSFKFIFNGRNSDNNYCISPISGTITPSAESTPGELIVKYKTFTTEVKETIRVLYTDYETIAVIYSCIYTVSKGCHPAGVTGSLWTRKPHVTNKVFNEAVKYLKQACIDQETILIRNVVGPCNLDNSDIENEENLVHDICYQPLDVGSCSANVKRYYYDQTTKQCSEFTYGGCDGNKNNFLSFHECEHRCFNNGEGTTFTQCQETSICGLHCPPCCRHTEDGCVNCDCQDIDLVKEIECPEEHSCPPGCSSEEILPSCYKCNCESDSSKERSGHHNEVMKNPISQNDDGTINAINIQALLFSILSSIFYNNKLDFL